MKTIQQSTAVMIAIVTLVLGGVVGWYGGMMNTSTTTTPPPTTTGISQQQVDLRLSMRKLWNDHVLWTRLYMIDVKNSLPSTTADTARLLKNQEDIGNAMKFYYGTTAGNQLTALLKEHITDAVAVLTAAKANDQTALADAKTKWYANGDAIATFLSQANSISWPLADMKATMKKHLDTTYDEAVDILQGKSDASVTDYDLVKTHIDAMADGLSSGIITQFPEKF